MKTQEQKLQHVKEAAGEKWNDTHVRFCGASDTMRRVGKPNPSPDDLNELFRLGRKVFSKSIKIELVFTVEEEIKCYLAVFAQKLITAKGKTDSEALINALFIATGGKDE